MTILSVYSSLSRERPQRLIGWKQVRRVHSPSLTEGGSAPPLQAFLLLSTVFALEWRGTKPEWPPVFRTGLKPAGVGGGGVEKVSMWNAAALMKSSYGPILLFLPVRDLCCPPSCSYVHACHSEDVALRKKKNLCLFGVSRHG